MSSAILIFSKSADRGQVKTRLRSALSEEQCLQLHLALLQDTLQKCAATHMNTILYLAGSGFLPFDPQIPVRTQQGKDLGERLTNAFKTELTSFRRIVIIGTDSPTFPATRITEAVELLSHSDLVLGPSDDGGYYLIAMQTLLPIFSNIPWGTSDVFRATMAAAASYQTSILPRCFDVDEPADLTRLRAELPQAKHVEHTRRWFEQNPNLEPHRTRRSQK